MAKNMNEVINEDTQQVIRKSVGEMLVERAGKVDKAELYTNKTQLLNMFKNDYSVLIEANKSKKTAKVQVYFGVGEVTDRFFKGKTNRAVRADSIMAFLDMIENLEK